MHTGNFCFHFSGQCHHYAPICRQPDPALQRARFSGSLCRRRSRRLPGGGVSVSPYAFERKELAQRLRDNGLQQVLFNTPPGDRDAGERGLACLPGREAEFRNGFAHALDYAQVLNCPRIHVMAGLALAGVERATLQAIYEAIWPGPQT